MTFSLSEYVCFIPTLPVMSLKNNFHYCSCCVSGGDGTPYIVNPQTMMVAPMHAAYANFPQQAGAHFQPQSPVYAPQVIHQTMMLHDPMVRNS